MSDLSQIALQADPIIDVVGLGDLLPGYLLAGEPGFSHHNARKWASTSFDVPFFASEASGSGGSRLKSCPCGAVETALFMRMLFVVPAKKIAAEIVLEIAQHGVDIGYRRLACCRIR